MKAKPFLILFAVMLFQRFPGAPQAFAANEDSIIIDTFSSCAESGIPCGWETNNKAEQIEMRHDSVNYFVHLKTEGTIGSIGKKKEYSIKKYPVLNWRWRVHTLPAKGREDVKKQSNSAAGIYVVFKGGFPFGRTLKYVWSATLPVGTMTKSPFNGKTTIIVVKSGIADTGTWISEEPNVLDDYKKAFGPDDPPETKGIAIITSSDRTNSTAAADYDDIYISKNPVAAVRPRLP